MTFRFSLENVNSLFDILASVITVSMESSALYNTECFPSFLQLTGMNDSMSEFNDSGKSSHSALVHTIQRHRDILQVANSFVLITYTSLAT